MQTEYITQKTKLKNFLLVPREILDLNLGSTALIVYLLMLDRARQSQTNPRFLKENQPIVYYSEVELCEKTGRARSSVSCALAKLKEKKLIEAKRTQTGANTYRIRLPSSSVQGSDHISPQTASDESAGFMSGKQDNPMSSDRDNGMSGKQDNPMSSDRDNGMSDKPDNRGYGYPDVGRSDKPDRNNNRRSNKPMSNNYHDTYMEEGVL